MLKAAASIDGLTGVELVGTWDIHADNVSEMASQLNELGLACASIIPDHFSQSIWWKGAFTSRDAVVRKKAVDVTLEACEFGKLLNCDLINIWNGQDGYDYPLQADYDQERTWLVEGLRECARSFPEMRFALEYKLKEPRTHSYLARMADTLLVCQEVGESNVGITIDVGHSMVGYEDVAEAVVLAKRAGNKLYHMHFNDNFRAWDDDMIVGSVHTVEYIELLYWLDRTGYTGWLSMDQYPYREDGRDALAESVAWLQGFQKKVDTHREEIDQLLHVGEATKTSAFLRKLFL
jgi:xylose isomerase